LDGVAVINPLGSRLGLAGLILAGGVGSRFGGPKAWARLPDGRTFLEACCETLFAAGIAPVVATLPPASDDPEISGLIAVPLGEPGLDMFASIGVGLGRLVKELVWDRVALLPVDHPLVRPAAVAALAGCEAPAAIPSYRGKHGHPVVFDRTTAEHIVSGSLVGPTLREVLRAVGAVDVDVDDPGTVANCNTPDALRRALSSIP
jgi:CTP:molybdopterin cytidylyltransferase MocA